MGKFNLTNFDYKEVKKMSYKDKEELAKEIREKIISSVSANGGHLSSNLGIVELTIALASAFSFEEDDILFDVGHQTYPYKILTSRDISKIRLEDGLLPFQSRKESKYDKFEAGHSSTSISIGLGMAASKKLSGDNSYTVVVIGDASIANGLAFEALNNINHAKNGKLIIILNDNNMSISKPQGAIANKLNKIRTSYSYQKGAGIFKKTFDRKGLRFIYCFFKWQKDIVKKLVFKQNFFSSFALQYLGPIDGHDINKLENFLKRAKNIDDSVLIHINTTKGKGYKYAEEDESGYWHGVSPFEISTGKPTNVKEDMISLSHVGGDAIYELLKKDEKAVLISPAMVKGSHLERCFNDFPSRCFDVGIEEEHALTFAAGLALKGNHPILSIYATFLQRGFDELLHDICRQELNVLIVVDRAGLVGQDGSSHQGIFDVDMALGLPNIEVITPYSKERLVKEIVEHDFTSNRCTLVREERTYVSSSEKISDEDHLFFDNTKDRLVISVGINAYKLAKKDLTNNHLIITNMSDYKFIDKGFVERYKKIYIYDSTSTEEGFSSRLLTHLVKLGYKGEIEILAIPSSFIDRGSRDSQLARLKLDVDSVLERITRE